MHDQPDDKWEVGWYVESIRPGYLSGGGSGKCRGLLAATFRGTHTSSCLYTSLRVRCQYAALACVLLDEAFERSQAPLCCPFQTPPYLGRSFLITAPTSHASFRRKAFILTTILTSIPTAIILDLADDVPPRQSPLPLRD